MALLNLTLSIAAYSNNNIRVDNLSISMEIVKLLQYVIIIMFIKGLYKHCFMQAHNMV